MLKELVEYSKRRGLAGPGFAPKMVRWAIHVPPDGPPGIVPLGDAADKKNPGRQFDVCPEASGMNAGGRSHFLVETLETVLLMCKKESDRPKFEAKHAFFVTQLRDAAATCPGCEGMLRFAEIVDDENQRAVLIAQLQEHKAKPTDKITVMIAGREPQFLVEDSCWHAWWGDYRKTLGKDEDETAKKGPAKAGRGFMRCFVTGEMVEPAMTHPKITELADVGASAMGSTLVSFDKDATCSYGLTQSTNAAMSEESAAAYRAGLNHILANHSKRLAGAKVAYWFKERMPDKYDAFELLLGGSNQAAVDEAQKRDALRRARDMLAVIDEGKIPDEVKNNHYYALTLSGNGGRVVVRDWMTGPFEELYESIRAWFSDLAIVALDSELIRIPLSFEQVLTCCLDERPRSQAYADWVKQVSPHREALWRAAIGGAKSPIPRSLVEQAVLRHTAMLLKHRTIINAKSSRDQSESNEPQKSYHIGILFARMAIMRAYCNRFSRTHHKGDYKVDTALDLNHPRTAYHVGRLMAVLEMIQRLAQGKIGATIAQTNYASAATRPLTSLPRIETLVQHHLPKIENDKLRKAYYDLLTEINSKIRGSIPRTFDLEDQCLFHLGYYHQRPYRPYSPSPHQHMTLNGEKVRSKSEVIVANLLQFLGIKYEYEKAVHFKDGSIYMGRRPDGDTTVTLHPDFTLLETNTGKNIFIEHLGMMDNYTYRHDWDSRKKLYRDHGVLSLEEGGGQNGAYVVTEEKNGTIDCQELSKILEPFRKVQD